MKNGFDTDVSQILPIPELPKLERVTIYLWIKEMADEDGDGGCLSRYGYDFLYDVPAFAADFWRLPLSTASRSAPYYAFSMLQSLPLSSFGP